MFTVREARTRAAVGAAVVVLLAVPLACPVTKAVLAWHDRRNGVRPDREHGRTAGAA